MKEGQGAPTSCCGPTPDDGPFDLVVIGGGSAGFAAALRADELGASVALVHDGVLGGTCVNVGCVPSKTLIRAAEEVYRARHPRFAGIETTGRVTDFEAVVEQKDRLVASLRQSKYADVLASRPRIRRVEGRARLVGRREVEVGGRRLVARRGVIIATGARPFVPPVPGLREGRPLTSTQLFALERLPESLLVLGGRFVALECAQMFARFGTRVTLLQRSPQVLPEEDEVLARRLEDYLRDEGIEIVTGVLLEEARRDANGWRVRARCDGEERTFAATHLLCATGRRPATAELGLEEIGARLGADGRLLVDAALESHAPGVFGAGDVLGEPQFVYTAARDGVLAAENALQERRRERRHDPLPWVLFTDPQVAGVGLNRRAAERLGIEIDVAHLELEHVPRALAARDTRGFIELFKERGGDRLLGLRVLAPEGGEIVQPVAVALAAGLGASSFVDLLHPYLTLSEALRLCAQTFERDVRDLSCCAG